MGEEQSETLQKRLAELQEERLRKQEQAEEAAHTLREAVDRLQDHGLHVVHLRNGSIRNLTINNEQGEGLQIALSTAWIGGDCTVLSVKHAGGRLFTIARVNEAQGDRFSRKAGWVTGAPRLINELLRLQEQEHGDGVAGGPTINEKDPATGEFPPRRWDDFYWMTENPGRDTIYFASMYAATMILTSHMERFADSRKAKSKH